MAIQIECPSCHRQAVMPESAVGKNVRCGCGQVIRLSSTGGEPQSSQIGGADTAEHGHFRFYTIHTAYRWLRDWIGSLRLSTVLFLTLSIVVTGLIWWRWEPWRLDYKIPERWLAISEENRYLATLSPSEEIKIWDLQSGLSKVLTVSHTLNVQVLINDRLQRVVTMESDRKYHIRLWDLKSLQQIGGDIALPREGMFKYPNLISQIPAINNKLILCDNVDWELWQFHDSPHPPTKLLSEPCGQGKVSPDHSFFLHDFDEVLRPPNALAGSKEARVAVWNLDTSRKLVIPGSIIGDISSNNRVVIDKESRNKYEIEEHQYGIYDLNAERHICELAQTRVAGLCSVRFTSDGNFVFLEEYGKEPECLDSSTGAKVSGQQSMMINGKFRNNSADNRTTFSKSIKSIDRRKRQSLAELFDYEEIGETLFEFPAEAYFIPQTNGTRVCLGSWSDAPTIWSRRHPEWWWGHFYRPEVWVGIVLAGFWLWKLYVYGREKRRACIEKALNPAS